MDACVSSRVCVCVLFIDLIHAQLNFSVYLQICNYLLLSASHTCFLRGSSQSVCLRIAFECHFGVIVLFIDLIHVQHFLYQSIFINVLGGQVGPNRQEVRYFLHAQHPLRKPQNSL